MTGKTCVELAAKEIEHYSISLIEIIESVSREQLWFNGEGIVNSIGTLARHLTGNLNHYFGAALLKNGYVRKRDREFTESGLDKSTVIADLRSAVNTAVQAIHSVDESLLDQPHTTPCGEDCPSLAEHILRLTTHFALHYGQADYAANMLKEK
jgi:hypothetical protein